MDRRRRITFIAGLAALATARSTRAQMQRYAALSLVGNKIEVVYALPGTGSHLDRNDRRTLDDVEGTLDRFVLQAVDDALRQRDRNASLAMLTLRGSALYDNPERLFQGRQIALPGAAVDAIEASKASHLIVLTKLRDEPRVRTYDQAVGIGTVRGLGFYVDNRIELRNRESGAYGTGLLAPFVYVRLNLIDVATGEVVREELVREMVTHATASNPKAATPWEVLSTEEKIDALQRLIARSIGDATARLLR